MTEYISDAKTRQEAGNTRPVNPVKMRSVCLQVPPVIQQNQSGSPAQVARRPAVSQQQRQATPLRFAQPQSLPSGGITHPAPLPYSLPKNNSNPMWKQLPTKPTLKLSKVEKGKYKLSFHYILSQMPPNTY